LFHLLVPGGQWQTVASAPIWSAHPALAAAIGLRSSDSQRTA